MFTCKFSSSTSERPSHPSDDVGHSPARVRSLELAVDILTVQERPVARIDTVDDDTQILTRKAADKGAAASARSERDCGREPSPRPAHDAAGFTGQAGSGSGRAPLRGGRAESPVGCRHHLHPDPGRLPLPGHRPRRVQPAGRGLGDDGSSAHGLGARGAGDGGGATPAGLGHPSLGPGLPVHVAGLWRPLPGVGRCGVDGLGGRLLRQRDGRELLRDAGVRAARPQDVGDARRGAGGRVRVGCGSSSSTAQGASASGTARAT